MTQPKNVGSGFADLDYALELSAASAFPATFGSAGNLGLAVPPATTNPRFPNWLQPLSVGAVQLLLEDGTTQTLNFSGGETVTVTFKTVISMSVSRLRLGASLLPPPAIPVAYSTTNLVGSASGIVAGTTRTQVGATVLTKSINRIDTSTAPGVGTTLGDGVALPAAGTGIIAYIVNNTVNPIQVYGNGTDTVNGIAGATGVPIPPGATEVFTSAAAGSWQYDAGMGSAGPLPIELAAANVAAAGANQAAATQLVAALNKVTTASAAQGVRLPLAVQGLDCIIENHSGVSIQVYGAGTDIIDDVLTTTGVVQMDSSVVIFTSYETGKWYTNGLATGYAKNPASGTVLETMQYGDALVATGTTQAGALQILAAINTFATVGVGSGCALPPSAPGLSVIVQNNGANPLQVYGAGTDTINGQATATGISILSGTAGAFNCTATGAWTTQPASSTMEALNLVPSVDANVVLTAAQISGAVANVDTQISGGAAITAGRNLQLPLVTALIAAMHAPTVGASFRLRVTNFQGGAFPLTVVTNTGWTLTGTTFSVPQNTWREFAVQVTSVAAATASLRPLATGTMS